jgi:hypothetical protein
MVLVDRLTKKLREKRGEGGKERKNIELGRRKGIMNKKY